MAECIAAEAPALAENYADNAIRIAEQIGARNDLAKAMVARATLCRIGGDVDTAQELFRQARATFQELDTRGEFAQIDAALAALHAASERSQPAHP
jgi:hypothetical protein